MRAVVRYLRVVSVCFLTYVAIRQVLDLVHGRGSTALGIFFLCLYPIMIAVIVRNARTSDALRDQMDEDRRRSAR